MHTYFGNGLYLVKSKLPQVHTWAYPMDDVEGCLVPVPLVPVHIHISRGYMSYEVIICDLCVSKSVICMYMVEPQHVIELLLHI